MSDPSADPYDVAPYRGDAFPQAHPDRLATMATLFGLRPAPVERCRLLELGSGDGTHLIAAAFDLPDSSFVGVDLAAAPIARGREAVRDLGLTNVTLRQGDLGALTAADGPFDYVVAHGVYSWVPAGVRDRLLAVCREVLAPQGVAFISYNTYPGCHMRRMLWDMMKFHARGAAGPEEAVGRSADLIRFLSAAHGGGDDGYSVLLRQELGWLSDADPGQVYHDDLAEVNDPVYFHEFAAHAGRHGLQFLAEADLSYMQDRIYPPEVTGRLRALAAADYERKEQYLDFVKARRFRQTLLCRAETTVDREPPPGRVAAFALASPARPASEAPDLGPGVVEEFRGPSGGVMRTDLPLAKAAMLVLGEAWPRRLPFAELLVLAAARLADPGEADADHTAALARVLLATAWSGLVGLHVHVPRLAGKAGERPLASPLARRQLLSGDKAVTLLHTTVTVSDEVSRRLLLLLDGTRDRTALRDALAEQMDVRPGTPDERAAFLAAVSRQIDQCLERAAALGLLIA